MVKVSELLNRKDPYKKSCKFCGASILMGALPSGKRVPLDAKLPVYVVTDDGTLAPATNMYAVHGPMCKINRERAGDGQAA